MQTILDGIMGRILEKIAVRVALEATAIAGACFLIAYLWVHIHIYWK